MAIPPAHSLADLQLEFAVINNIVYAWDVKSGEFKRWLAKQGVTFGPGKGSHLHLFLHGRQSVLPMHHKDISKGLIADIKKQLGIK